MATLTTPAVETPPTHPFAGRSRALPALLVTAGGVLQVVQFAIVPHDLEIPDRLAWWVEHPIRIGIAQAVGLLALPFLVGGFLVIGRLCLEHSRRVATAAVSLLVAAMVGLGAIHGLEMTTNWLAQDGAIEQATMVQAAADPGIAGITLMVMFLGGALFGMVLLNVALWRSRFVPRVAVPFTVGFVVLDFFLGRGLLGHLSILVADVILAWAVVTGYLRNHHNRRGLRAH
jgi:hypothetical protein